MLLYIWMLSWPLIALSVQARGYDLFCAAYSFILGYTLIFQV